MKKLVKNVNLSSSKQSKSNLDEIIGNSSFMSDENIDLRKNISYLLYAIHCNKFEDYYNEDEIAYYRDLLKRLKENKQRF